MKLTQEQVDHLQTLETADGRLTPDAVVDDARSKASPLHDLFEWDNKKAASAWRIQQAREVIQVRMQVVNETVAVRAPIYVRDPEATGQGYIRVSVLRNDPEQSRAAVTYALDVAAGHLRRAYEMAEPLGMAQEIEALVAQVTGLRRVLEKAA